MKKEIVDARGLACPQPLILTRKALLKLSSGDTVDVLIDNPTSMQNVERFCKENGASVQVYENNGVYTLTVRKEKELTVSSGVEQYCDIPAPRSSVICIKSDRMGSGADELGEILMKGLINTVNSSEHLPETVVFYNNGVKLTLQESPVLPSLKELEAKGVSIMVCGTCADYYKVKELVGVGVISNLYDIYNVLAQAGHIVYP